MAPRSQQRHRRGSKGAVAATAAMAALAGSTSVDMEMTTALPKLNLDSTRPPSVPAGGGTGHASRAAAGAAVGATAAAARGGSEGIKAATTGSSLTTSIVNLSKNIIGAGMLSLPFAMKGAGVIPFLCGLAIMGALNAYTFFLLGWCCKSVGASSFGELWAKTFGPQSAWIADLSVMLNNGLACLAYCVLIGDFMSKSLAGLLPSVVALHGRGTDLVLAALCLLLPLSLLRDLAPLRFSSIAGLGATLYGFLLLSSDCFLGAEIMNPDGPVMRNMFPLRADLFASLALFSSAFMAHYNSPKFYADLQDNTPERFGKLVLGAFGVAFVAFSIFGFAGFAIFGFEVQGNVLTNYGAGTKVMLAWLGMAFSVIFTYPLVFSTFRDATASLLSRSGHLKDPGNSSFRVPFTAAAVGLTVLGGTFFKNVAIVNGIKGAVLSACLAFIYPARIHLKLTAPGGPACGATSPQTMAWMRMGSQALALVGGTTGVLALLAMFVLPKTDFSTLAAETAHAVRR